MIQVKYTFILDDNTTWRTYSEFENDLANFFVSLGLHPEPVKTDPPNQDKIILVTKADEIMPSEAVKLPEIVKNIQSSTANQLNKKRGYNVK